MTRDPNLIYPGKDDSFVFPEEGSDPIPMSFVRTDDVVDGQALLHILGSADGTIKISTALRVLMNIPIEVDAGEYRREGPDLWRLWRYNSRGETL